jgi:hypothetical protein
MIELSGGQTIEERALPLIGGRRFWIFDADPPASDPEGGQLFNAAFEELDASYQEDRSSPIGVCVPVSDPELIRRRPEAVWPETDLLYAGTQREAGTLADARPTITQLRVRYFYDATVGPGYPNSPSVAESEAQDYSLPPGYRIVPLRETDAANTDDVLELWARERAMPDPNEARRRVHEVLMVALDADDRVAGVSTAFLERSAQLDLDLWNLRGSVSSDHRLANLAVRLLWASRDHLSERFAGGEDRRGAGMIMHIENEGLRRYFNRAFWVYSNFYFIGENERGDHVVAHYFPGAQVPIPQ